jgi:hypothetical protein
MVKPHIKVSYLKTAAFIFRIEELKMEATGFSGTLVPVYQTERFHIPEDRRPNRDTHRHENLGFHMDLKFTYFSCDQPSARSDIKIGDVIMCWSLQKHWHYCA